MGTRSSNHTATLVYNAHSTFESQADEVALHIIIPTVGKHSIFTLLESLAPQLRVQVS